MVQAAGIRSRNAGDGSSQFVSPQRLGALIAGSTLAILGVTRRSKSGVALAAAGGFLAYRGATAKGQPKESLAEASLLLNCSPQEAYRFWRDFENLPLVMPHLESVTKLDARRYRWIAVGPLGAKARWDVEITEEREGQSIGWRSLPESDLSVEGQVEFRNAPANRGTIVAVRMHYRLVAGRAGFVAMKLLEKYPKFALRQDLRRFKALVETGEIPTTEGQTHGPRSSLVSAARLIDPARPIRGEARIPEVLDARRRVS